MSDHLGETLWLIGAGPMAVEYAHALDAVGESFEVVGRGEESARAFERATGSGVVRGGLASFLDPSRPPAANAIVAVGVEQLAEATSMLVEAGVRRVLVEKPGGLDAGQIESVARRAADAGAKVFVAYNRRFYASVREARRLIDADGGPSSFAFEFTEIASRIEAASVPEEVKRNWLLANSSHVIDLAFHLGGSPREIACKTAGGLSWHPAAAVFAGSGITTRGALFSYHANWAAPGRWGLDVCTAERRLILRPLEKLKVQYPGDFTVHEVELEDAEDDAHKPGVYRQTLAFCGGEDDELVAIGEQVGNLRWYDAIVAGSEITSPHADGGPAGASGSSLAAQESQNDAADAQEMNRDD